MEPAAAFDRAERSRGQILQAARTEFIENGYAGASLNRIILASGLTKGGFYFHFPSKLALALAVLDEEGRLWQERVAAEVATLPNIVDRMVAVPRLIVRLAREGRGPAPLRRLADELAANPDVREEVCGSLRTWIRSAAEDFREAQQTGWIGSEVDTDALAEVAIAGFIGMQTITEQFDDDEMDRRLDALDRVLTMALAPSSPPGSGKE
ncbi:MAG TPA: TetR/AcrR family transcriptional regulator [Actinomycetota bacterium]